MKFYLLPLLLLLCITQSFANKETEIIIKNTPKERKRPPYHKNGKPNYYNYTLDISSIKDVSLDIERILRQISSHTCLIFKKKDTEIKDDIGINFKKSLDKNEVILSESTSQPTTVTLTEEVYKSKTNLSFFIGVAFGIITEIQRPDSDQYVTVDNKNLNTTCYNEYYEQVNPADVPYIEDTDFDFKSPMLINPNFFSNNSEPTYTIKGELYEDYQNLYGFIRPFRFNDYKHIYNYHCDRPKEHTNCQNGGFKPNDSFKDKCYCPKYFTGNQCQDLYSNHPSCTKKEQYHKAQSGENSLLLEYVKGPCYYSITSENEGNVSVIIENLKFGKDDCSNGNFVEVLFQKDKGAAGLILCRDRREIKFTSQSKNVIIVLYGAGNTISLTVKYQEISEIRSETV
uniref:Astacin domain-containing protein n=1 Tax=Strongyloides papillosus TaxID=174720 RepID=A0A0N5BG90_STREA